MTAPLMTCGCAAVGEHVQAHDNLPSRHPSCITHGCCEVARIQPDLEGRTSRCGYCRAAKPSSLALAFFEYRPDQSDDRHYCGCRGWD